MSQTRTCLTCRFSKETEEGLECRKRAPILALVDRGHGQGPVKLTLWPAVLPADDWCDEHKLDRQKFAKAAAGLSACSNEPRGL